MFGEASAVRKVRPSGGKTGCEKDDRERRDRLLTARDTPALHGGSSKERRQNATNVTQGPRQDLAEVSDIRQVRHIDGETCGAKADCDRSAVRTERDACML